MEYHPSMVFRSGPAPARDPRVEIIDPENEHWPGIFDSTNPKEWWGKKKFFNTAVPAIACFVVGMAASIYAPASADIEAAFNVSATQALLGITSYVLGMSFGPLVAGPVSETFGRRAVYLVALPIFGLFTLGVAVARNFATIVICRFLSAVFGSGVLAVGAGTIADMYLMYYPHSVYGSTMYLVMAFLGPSFGPLAGYHLLARGYNWQWPMFLICMLVFPTMICVFFTEETHKACILKKRFIKQGFRIKHVSFEEKMKTLFTRTLIRPLKMLCVEPIVIFTSLYNGFCFATFFGYFETVPIVLQTVYHIGPKATGNAFVSLTIGAIIAAIYCCILEKFYYQKRMCGRAGSEIPEDRVVGGLLGSLCLPFGIFLFSFTAKENIHVLCPLFGLVIFSFGAVSTFICSMVYLVHIYNHQLSASAVGANGFIRYSMAATFPLFMPLVYERFGIKVAGAILGGVSFALLPVPWILFFCGARLRSLSDYVNPHRKLGMQESRENQQPIGISKKIINRFRVLTGRGVVREIGENAV